MEELLSLKRLSKRQRLACSLVETKPEASSSRLMLRRQASCLRLDDWLLTLCGVQRHHTQTLRPDHSVCWRPDKRWQFFRFMKNVYRFNGKSFQAKSYQNGLRKQLMPENDKTGTGEENLSFSDTIVKKVGGKNLRHSRKPLLSAAMVQKRLKRNTRWLKRNTHFSYIVDKFSNTKICKIQRFPSSYLLIGRSRCIATYTHFCWPNVFIHKKWHLYSFLFFRSIVTVNE